MNGQTDVGTDRCRDRQSDPYVRFFFKRATQKHSTILSVKLLNLNLEKGGGGLVTVNLAFLHFLLFLSFYYNYTHVLL